MKNVSEATRARIAFLTSLITPEQWAKLKRQAVHQMLPTALLMLTLAALYFLSTVVKPGWTTYWISFAALVVIWLTAVARVNDITQYGKRWHVRRLGLMLCVTSGVALMSMPLFPVLDFPSWSEVMLRWGFALTWFTTPNMPPWWKYIAGADRRVEPRNEESQV